MSAVTAPGGDRLPWDEAACADLGPHEHSGMLGCRVVKAASDEWNAQAADAWRRLHRRTYQETIRRTGPGSVRLLARVWEIQARGVLHVHPVLGYGTACEMAGARAYLRRLAVLAPRYGFGFVDHDPRRVKPHPAAGAAAYLSSYFVKGSGRKAALWESVTSEAMPRSIIHVSAGLTQKTRCTMRILRVKRAIHHAWGDELPFQEVHLVAKFFEVFRGSVELVPVSQHRRGPPGESDRRGRLARLAAPSSRARPMVDPVRASGLIVAT